MHLFPDDTDGVCPSENIFATLLRRSSYRLELYMNCVLDLNLIEDFYGPQVSLEI